MKQRNRASGWKYAKLSGHKNEDVVADLLLNDSAFQKHFLERLKMNNKKIVSVDAGGLMETDVPCIFDNEKTKSKTDIVVYFNDNSSINISLKKSIGGQAYLIGVERFIKGFEIQFDKTIPENIKNAIRLYWGSHIDEKKLIEQIHSKNYSYEKRKNRLTKDSLDAIDPQISISLLDWFSENIYDITDFCFSKGLASSSRDWARFLWFYDSAHPDVFDDIYCIKDLCFLCEQNIKQTIFYGDRTGGSTIQLPFGFVQWHSPRNKIPGNLQFHDDYNKISSLF